MNLSLNRSDDVHPRWLDEGVVESIRTICTSLEPHGVTINVVVVDDQRIREINREFRGVDGATDVLSFSYLEEEVTHPEDDLAGEIYISWETVEKEAKQLGVVNSDLFLRVAVHGLLHVLGYDHEREREAADMESRERVILEEYLDEVRLRELF